MWDLHPLISVELFVDVAYRVGEGSPIDSEVWNLHLIAVCQPMA